MKIDPRVNFISVLVITSIAFIIPEIWSGALLLALAFVLSIVVGAKPDMMRRYFRRLLWLAVMIFLVQALFYHSGDRILALPHTISIGGLSLTIPSALAGKGLFSKEGCIFGTYLVLRLGILIMMAVYFNSSTTPSRFITGLNKMGIPHSVGLGVNIALRFIPDMGREINEMKTAQQARGRKFEEGNIFRRLRNLLGLLKPLVIRYIIRTRHFSQVIRSRGYVLGKKRTSIYRLRMSGLDWAYLFALISLLAAAVFYRL